jgi:hypothetical protein
MPNDSQTSGLIPLHENIDMLRKIAVFPAMTTMVFLRRRLGFRLLTPTWLLVFAIILMATAGAVPSIAAPYSILMVLYGLAMLGMGAWQYWQRWHELCNGVRWHSYAPGVSYLEVLPWPMVMRSHRRVNRFVDPIAVALIGLVIGIFCHALGLWIMVSGLFIYVYEQQLFEAIMKRELDTLDGLLTAELQMEIVKHFEQPQSNKLQPKPFQKSLEETAGIPTGVATDIEMQVAIRKAELAALEAAEAARAEARRPKPSPDNLAKEGPEASPA